MFNCLKLFFILFVTKRCYGRNIVILASEKSFLQTCDAADSLGNVNMKDLLEFNLKYHYADDMETLITNGTVTFLNDLPQDTLLEFSAEILEWRRGKWENTIYSIRRSDFCSAMFSPLELWYSFTKSIPMEDRVCPPVKGTVYHIDNLENRLELENVNIDVEGEFKVISHVKSGSYAACIATTVEVWKN